MRMADGKWITGLEAGQPATAAALQVLNARLPIVAHYLPLAASKADEDMEYVHQLRVATRRCGAALRIFRPVLIRRRHKHAKALLRSIRQTAGAARDWDVFLQLIDDCDSLKKTSAEATIDFLIGYCFGERAAAQEAIVAIANTAQSQLVDLLETLPSATLPPADDGRSLTVFDLANTVLRELFTELATEIDAKPETPDDLHQLRITGKRVRYAMEIFAGLYQPPFRNVLYPAVEQMQEILGHIQDGHTAIRRITLMANRLWAVRPSAAERIMPGLNDLIQEFRDRIATHKKEFREWTRHWKSLAEKHPLSELLMPLASP
jgi:CHAD domain-containing protein